jgi:hypothetical protein
VSGGEEVAAWVVLAHTVVAHASAEAVVKGSNTVTTGAAKPIATIRLRNPRRSCAPAPVCGSFACSSGWLPRLSVAIAESYHGRATLFGRAQSSVAQFLVAPETSPGSTRRCAVGAKGRQPPISGPNPPWAVLGSNQRPPACKHGRRRRKQRPN